ncbi:hypothetical protein [Yoonia sp. SS1-5]|uniref:Uncharacterized protein n=1 Tax=Yoonia rhodophyticola TaxID=3137370 RepID=A0AAN0NJU4_9RHOB
MSDVLIMQLWPVHLLIWLGCMFAGAVTGRLLVNQTQTRLVASLIQVGIALSLAFGLLQLISSLSTMQGLPDLTSWDKLFQLYLDFNEFDIVTRSWPHQLAVLQSTAIALALWLVAGLGVMFMMWEDDL